MKNGGCKRSISCGPTQTRCLSRASVSVQRELRHRGTNRGTSGWYTTLWALARYAGTKRLNEHLRTPRQSRVNRTWLILSRKICGGRLPHRLTLIFLPLPPICTAFFFLASFFFIIPRANTRDERSRRPDFSLLRAFSLAIKNNYGRTNGYELLSVCA